MNEQLLRGMRRFLGFGILLTCVLALAGCGSSGMLQGKVTFKNQPLPAGTRLIFEHEKTGRVIEGQVEADGNYRVEKVPVGKIKIAVQIAETGQTGGSGPSGFGAAVQKKGGDIIGPPKDSKDLITPPGGLGDVFKKDPNAKSIPIPLAVKDPKTSPISVEVTGGKQEFNIVVPES